MNLSLSGFMTTCVSDLQVLCMKYIIPHTSILSFKIWCYTVILQKVGENVESFQISSLCRVIMMNIELDASYD